MKIRKYLTEEELELEELDDLYNQLAEIYKLYLDNRTLYWDDMKALEIKILERGGSPLDIARYKSA